MRGCFHWSLMENFEWIAGYRDRYGLYYVDFETPGRIPTLSSECYRHVVRHDAVMRNLGSSRRGAGTGAGPERAEAQSRPA